MAIDTDADKAALALVPTITIPATPAEGFPGAFLTWKHGSNSGFTALPPSKSSTFGDDLDVIIGHVNDLSAYRFVQASVPVITNSTTGVPNDPAGKNPTRDIRFKSVDSANPAQAQVVSVKCPEFSPGDLSGDDAQALIDDIVLLVGQSVYSDGDDIVEVLG